MWRFGEKKVPKGPLVLILPEMSGYVKTFKVKDKSNKLEFKAIRKTILTKIEKLKKYVFN